MKPQFSLSVSALALALSAAPLAAQQRAQDFTLPPGGTPTPTPEAAGPVDEAAGVTIPPRTIQAPTPTPTPAFTPAPAAVEPEVQPVPTPAPTPASSSPPDASQPAISSPATASVATPSPTSTPPIIEPDGDTATSDASPPAFTLPTPEPIAPAPHTEQAAASDAFADLPAWWPWAAGLLAALLAGGAGGWAFARNRANAVPAPIEPPVVPASTPSAPVATGVRTRINLEIESLMRSMMMLTARYQVTIANRSDSALRDIHVHADLISARRDLPMEQQVATLQCALPEAGQIARIGPQQMGTLRGQLQLPMSEFEIFQQGQTPLCVPLVRLRIEALDIEPQCHTFLVGLDGGHMGGRVQPLPLSGPPGGYSGVQAKRIEQPA